MEFVQIAPNLEMATTPCTQKEWRELMGTDPSCFKGDSLPVEKVSYYDVMDACVKANSIQDKWNYRLPTEEEWEAAAKSCDDQPILDCAWVYENSGGTTHPVAQKLPNAFGLYDILGNVWQWTNSLYEGQSSLHVILGGSWFSSARNTRSARRGSAPPGHRCGDVGFRFVRTPRKTLPLLPSDTITVRSIDPRIEKTSELLIKAAKELLEIWK